MAFTREGVDGASNELWSRTFGGTDWDGVYSFQQTSDGGYIVAGRTRSFGADVEGDMYLIKADGDGNDVGQVAWQGRPGFPVHVCDRPERD